MTICRADFLEQQLKSTFSPKGPLVRADPLASGSKWTGKLGSFRTSAASWPAIFRAIGAEVVGHARCVAFQMVEVAIARNVFADILRMTA
jgi:hypothetical protein